MDSMNRRIQALGAGAVAVFLVAGAALGTDALLRTPNPRPVVSLTSEELATPAGAVQVAQPTETPEPTETTKPTETTEPTRSRAADGTQNASETPEPTETPEASDATTGTSSVSNGDDDVDEQGEDDAPSTTGVNPVRTPEPTHAPGSGDSSGQD